VDKSRSFDVASGDVLIHDVGSAFTVYRKVGSTHIAVMEGRVHVVAPLTADLRRKFDRSEAINSWESAPKYSRLQQLEFDEATRAIHLGPALSESGVSQLLAWQEGRIDLNGLTLSAALAELSRYRAKTICRFSDRSVAEIRLGGNVDVEQLDDFLALLERLFQIHHTTQVAADGSTVITLSRTR
jgi:transmembrane sensor